MVETQRIVEWLQRPVRIPSVGPGNAGPRSGAIDEGRIAAQAATWLEALGGKVESEDVYPGRPNTYGVWRGQTDRWIAVDVHVDTVGVETVSPTPKFSAVISFHPNSRSNHGSQFPCPAIAFASISRLPISTMSPTTRLPRANGALPKEGKPPSQWSVSAASLKPVPHRPRKLRREGEDGAGLGEERAAKIVQ